MISKIGVLTADNTCCHAKALAPADYSPLVQRPGITLMG